VNKKSPGHRAVLRRLELGRASQASGSQRGGYRFHGWPLERRGRELFGPNRGFSIANQRRNNLLLAFLESSQRPLTREHLMQVTRRHQDIFDRSIDVQVLRLRRKLEADPTAPNVIRPERGIGYVFIPSAEAF
jgi:two-component system OmpR family response regulator